MEKANRYFCDITTLSAEAHARELRVDKSSTRTNQGESVVERINLPSAGAKPGLTYRDVKITLHVSGSISARISSRATDFTDSTDQEIPNQ